MIRKAMNIAALQLKLMVRDRASFIWLLLVPIVFTTLVGAAFGGFGRSGPAPRVPVAFVDLDHSAESAIFEQALQAETSLDIQKPTEADGRQLVMDEKVRVLVVIPAGFGADVEGGRQAYAEVVRAAGASSGYFLEQLVSKAATRVSTLAYAASVTADQQVRWQKLDTDQRLAAWRQAFAAAETALSTAPVVTTDYSVLAVEQPQEQLPDNRTQTSTGFGVMFVMAGILSTATFLVSERLRNTLARLLTTPLSVGAFLGGKMLSMMILGLLQFAVFILWGVVVLKVNWGSNLPAVIAVVASFTFGAAGVGVLVGAVCKTMAQAGAIATFVTYGTSMLAGSWWPVEIMPPFMQRLARLFPQYWAVNGLNKIIVRGLGFDALAPDMAVLLLTGTLCLVAGSVVFARRSRS